VLLPAFFVLKTPIYFMKVGLLTDYASEANVNIMKYLSRYVVRLFLYRTDALPQTRNYIEVKSNTCGIISTYIVRIICFVFIYLPKRNRGNFHM
jgi:hypothetical protein